MGCGMDRHGFVCWINTQVCAREFSDVWEFGLNFFFSQMSRIQMDEILDGTIPFNPPQFSDLGVDGPEAGADGAPVDPQLERAIEFLLAGG